MTDLFDHAASLAARDHGKQVAADNRPAILELARTGARILALRNGEVTADDVQERLVAMGYSPEDLGNAAGSIFRGGEWEAVGFAKSRRVARHAGTVRVWRLRA